MNITLSKIFNYLEEKENCEIHKKNNKIVILDVEKTGRVLYKKDLRLLNDLAKDYVQKKYPLFHKDLFEKNSYEDIILFDFRIPIDVKKYKKVKSFKKIIKKKLIGSPNKNGQVTIHTVIRKRKKK